MTKHIDRKGWLGLVLFVAIVAAVAVAAVVVAAINTFD